MNFSFESTKIKDVVLINTKVYKDIRGYFLESYKQTDFKINGKINCTFVQDNLSFSKKDVIRGLHFQVPPFVQAKLVQCIKGSIFDVAVDLRTKSKTFGSWVGEVLSDKNGKMLFIPEGFAHGFLSLEDNSIISYKCSNVYSKQHEGGVIYNDPKIGIEWLTNKPIVLEKDLYYPNLENLPPLFN